MWYVEESRRIRSAIACMLKSETKGCGGSINTRQRRFESKVDDKKKEVIE